MNVAKKNLVTNMNVKYDRVVCINLDNRPEKFEQFQKGLPEGFIFGHVERYQAISGTRVKSPDWWHGGNGAWGCYCSHRRIIEECLNAGLNSVLIFEDDAVFCSDFNRKVDEFHNALPNDAEWVYYGGQLLKTLTNPPIKINDLVYVPYNVNRTHAYGIIGREALQEIYKFLCGRKWGDTPHHIDHHYGALHGSGRVNTYCPAHWFVDQRAGKSDVAFRMKKNLHWKDAADVQSTKNLPFFSIIGTHSSGSSALAGALYHLGVHLGNTLVGFHGDPPINGGEAVFLHRLFEKAYPVPATESNMATNILQNKIRQFINEKQVEAKTQGTVAAGKYPQMAFVVDYIEQSLGNNHKAIWIKRPIEESILSLQKRFPNIGKDEIAKHQKAIFALCEHVTQRMGARAYIITYNQLLNNTENTIDGIIDFMKINPTSEQRTNAINYIDPSKKHV